MPTAAVAQGKSMEHDIAHGHLVFMGNRWEVHGAAHGCFLFHGLPIGNPWRALYSFHGHMEQ